MSQQLAICIDNAGYEVSLETRKLYIRISDTEASKHGQVRIIDESGEDYLFPDNLFIDVSLPQDTQNAVIAAA